MDSDPPMLEPDGRPPLWNALDERDFEKAARLIEQGARLDDLIEPDGDSFLHRAAHSGDLEMIGFLLKHGCPSMLGSFDYIQATPLIRAADNGRIHAVQMLLEAGGDPNADNEERIGNTAIREAVRGGHAQIVSLLLEAGADPTIPGWMGISAVDQAYDGIEGGYDSDEAKEILKLLARFPSTLRDRKPK